MLNTQAKAATANRPASSRSRSSSALLQRRINRLSRHIESVVDAEILSQSPEIRQVADNSEVTRLVRLALAGDTDALLAAVRSHQQLGATAEHLCLTTLTYVAREMGDWWDQDRCGFVEVTLGMLALQTVLRDLAPSLSLGPVGAQRRSALMLPMPGEHHSFGISMLAEFFRAGGWHVAQDSATTDRALVQRVSHEWFGIVALSCGAKDRLSALPGLIEAIRAKSCNPDIAIMVGGAAFCDDAARALLAGADATAANAAEALARAEGLVGLLAASP